MAPFAQLILLTGLIKGLTCSASMVDRHEGVIESDPYISPYTMVYTVVLAHFAKIRISLFIIVYHTYFFHNTYHFFHM